MIFIYNILFLIDICIIILFLKLKSLFIILIFRFDWKFLFVEPSGVQCFDESNPLKDDEASALLDAVVLVLALFWGSSML